MKRYFFFFFILTACAGSEIAKNKTSIILPSPPEFDRNFFQNGKSKKWDKNNLFYLAQQPENYQNDSLWLAELGKKYAETVLFRPIDNKTKSIVSKIKVAGSSDSLLLSKLHFDNKTTQQLLFSPKGELIEYSHLDKNLLFLPAPDSSRALICVEKKAEDKLVYSFYKYDNNMLINMLDNFSANLPDLENTLVNCQDSNQDGLNDLIFTDKNKQQFTFLYQKSKDMFMYEAVLK